MNIKERKNLLRAKHKKIRATFCEDIKKNLDRVLYEKFIELKEYKESKILFAFVSMSIEVNTFPILRNALADGKLLALPKCRQNEPVMDFYEVNSQVYFGEYTFFDSSGMAKFNPVEWDYKFGSYIKLL